MLARSKQNKIEIKISQSKISEKSKTSEALMNSQISHEDFMTIISEERKYRE